MRAFEEFKATNDERLDGDRAAPTADVLTEEKLARIDARSTSTSAASTSSRSRRHARRSARDERGRAAPRGEHKAAFDAYVRSGESAGLRALEDKAMSVGSNPDGGYLVPAEIETEIGAAPVADLADPRDRRPCATISGNVYKKPFMTAGPGRPAGSARPMRARRPTRRRSTELSFPAMELYAMPAATATLLEDSAVNIDQWIADEVEQAFAEQEGAAFVNGDGTNKPKGFLAYTTVAEASWAWGKIGYIATGVAGAFPASQSVRRAGRPRLCAEGRLSPERQLRDEPQDAERGAQVQGRRRQLSLAAAGARPAGAPTLMSFPVVEAEDMPDIAGDTLLDRVRRFPPRLSGRRPRRRARAARSLHRQALRAVLHDQARRRRRAGLRRDQAAEVRRELSSSRPTPSHEGGGRRPGTGPIEM